MALAFRLVVGSGSLWRECWYRRRQVDPNAPYVWPRIQRALHLSVDTYCFCSRHAN